MMMMMMIYIYIYIYPCGIVANLWNCDIVVSEFEVQSYYHIHFQTHTLEKGMNPLIPRPV